MKKTLLLLTTVYCTLFAPNSRAQNYTYSLDHIPYANLSGATTDITPASWDGFDVYSIPVGFSFKFYGSYFTTLYLGGGQTSFNDLINMTTAVVDNIIPMSAGLMQSASISPSKMHYKVQGTTGARTLIVEWLNNEFMNDNTAGGTDFINFQLWLYEATGVIEFRYGSSQVSSNDDWGTTTTTGSMIYIGNGTTHATYYTALTGPAANPTVTAIATNTITGAPPSGTVYRFSPGTNGIATLQNSDAINLYPNPASNVVFVDGLKDLLKGNNYNVAVKNILGETVYTTTSNQNKLAIELSHFSKGIYLLNINAANKLYTKKFVVE